MTIDQLSKEQIMEQLREWPRARRIELAAEILAGASAPEQGVPKQNFAHLIGLLNPEGREFTDEEVDRMLDEARAERLGL